MTTGTKATPDFSHDTVLWLAGLLEGEGSFLSGSPSSPGVPRITISMTDEDVMKHAAAAFGVSMCRSSRNPDRWQPSYFAQLRGESAVRMMKTLYPLMGRRRQRQIDKALTCWQPKAWRLTPEGESRILRLVGEGVSYRKIGRLMGVSRTTVGNVVARNKVS